MDETDVNDTPTPIAVSELRELRRQVGEIADRLDRALMDDGGRGVVPNTVADDLLLPGQAAKLAKRSERTIRRWVKEYQIGWRCGSGSVLVSRARLLAHLHDSDHHDGRP